MLSLPAVIPLSSNKNALFNQSNNCCHIAKDKIWSSKLSLQ